MHFFIFLFLKISGVSASATYWPVLESAGVLECKVLDSRAVPLSACKQKISPAGELFPHLHPSFHPGVCPSRIGRCCVLPSAAGCIVTQAEKPLPGVPAMHVCLGAYWMLGPCSAQSFGVPAVQVSAWRQCHTWQSHSLTSRSRDRLNTRGLFLAGSWVAPGECECERCAILFCRSSTNE